MNARLNPFPILIPAVVLVLAWFVPWPWGFLPAGHVFAYWWWRAAGISTEEPRQ